MKSVGTRGVVRAFLVFLAVWLGLVTPSFAQELPPTPVNVQAVQTGDGEVTVTFDPGEPVEGSGPTEAYFINAMPDNVGSYAPGSPYVFTGLPVGEHTIGVFAEGPLPDQWASPPVYVDVTVYGTASVVLGSIPDQIFGSTLDLTPYATVLNGQAAYDSLTPSVCTVTGAIVTFLSAGSCEIAPSVIPNQYYLLSVTSTQTFSIQAVEPGQPSGVTAAAGNGQAIVSFTASADAGGGVIDYYEVTSSPATSATQGAGSPITVMGLENGVSYTFSVRAHNSRGFSSAADSTVPVTPKGDQIITFDPPGAQSFGAVPTLTATATSGLAVSFTSSSLTVCTVSGDQVTLLTTGTCTIDADQPGDAAYLAAPQVSQSFAVDAVAPGAPTGVSAVFGAGEATVSFSPPAFDGGASVSQYTVTSSPGGLTATGANSPITISGLANGTEYTFTVTAQNSAGSGGASDPSNAGVPVSGQTIDFADPGPQDFGSSPTLDATASSGLPVVFTSSTAGVCTITEGGLLTLVSTGSCTIDANQEGDSAYSAAPQVSRTFDVDAIVPGAPTIGTATAGNGEATVTFTPPSSNGGTTIIGYTVTSSPGGFTGTAAGSPITVTGLANGTAYTFTVTATNGRGTGGASSPSNEVTPKGSQTISFADPGPQNFGTTPTLTASVSSGLSAVFTSGATGVCTIAPGGSLTFVTAGSCTINANQAGDAGWLPATEVSRTFTVNAVLPAAPVINSVDFGSGQATVHFSPPSSNGGATILDYTVTASPGGATGTGTSSPITVLGLVNGSSYTFTVTARNSVGMGTASSPSSAGQPVAPQSISFSASAQQQVGVAASLSATATSGLPVSFSSLTTGVCTIASGGALTLIAPGTCTIRASQGGGSGYGAATPVDQSFTVIAAAPLAVIPTLTEWAMMLLGGMLALMGAAMLYRRRAMET